MNTVTVDGCTLYLHLYGQSWSSSSLFQFIRYKIYGDVINFNFLIISFWFESL